jgi:hypothetical protein
MSTSTKNTTATTTPATTEAKRPVGRPRSFPGVSKADCTMFAASIPTEARDGLVALAKQRNIPINVLLNNIAMQAITKAAKDRARRASK